MLSRDELARIVPGQTTREQVLQIAGGNPEEFEQLQAPRVQLAVEAFDECERLLREDVRPDCRTHAVNGACSVNWASSVEPLSASVDASGDTA